MVSRHANPRLSRRDMWHDEYVVDPGVFRCLQPDLAMDAAPGEIEEVERAHAAHERANGSVPAGPRIDVKEPVRRGAGSAQLLLDRLGQVAIQLLFRLEFDPLRVPRPRHLNLPLELPPALVPFLADPRIRRINLKLPGAAKVHLTPRLTLGGNTKRLIAEKNERKRKKKNKKWRQAVTFRLVQSLGHGGLADLKSGGPEIGDGPTPNTRGTQVTKRLGDVILDDGFRRLDLKDELPVDNNVRDVLASDGP